MNVNRFLSQTHQKEYSYLVGNATVGIYLIFKAFGIRKKRIVLPNSICPNVPLAILYSDNIPVFFDISSINLGLSHSDLLASKDTIDAVLANHSYGSICDIEEIRNFCKSHNKLFIEDFAVAQGGKYKDRPVGSFGDVSIVSFGAGKIVSIGHGGAILSNDSLFIEEIKKLEKTFNEFKPENENGISHLAKHYKDLYNTHYGTEKWRNDISFYNKAEKNKNSFFHKFSKQHEPLLLEKLEDMQNNIKRRNEKAAILTKLFKQERIDGINIYEPPEGSVYWRFNLFIKKNRNQLLKALLKKKYLISSWYPSVSVLFTDKAIKMATPNSDLLSDEIINIWVNDEVDSNYLTNIVSEVVEHCCY